MKKMNRALELLDRLIEASIEKPEITPDRVLIIDIKSENLERIFTPERKEILEIIKSKKPKTVGEIARLTRRRKSAISRDLKILENYGLIELVQSGQTKIPRMEKDLVMVPL